MGRTVAHVTELLCVENNSDIPDNPDVSDQSGMPDKMVMSDLVPNVRFARACRKCRTWSLCPGCPTTPVQTAGWPLSNRAVIPYARARVCVRGRSPYPAVGGTMGSKPVLIIASTEPSEGSEKG